jgi:hypothetical protein
MLRCGAIMLKHVLKVEDGDALDRSCSCGGNFVNQKQVQKTIRTVVGEVPVGRTYQRCNSCGDWRVPDDIVLDVEGTGFSPGLRRMMARTGADIAAAMKDEITIPKGSKKRGPTSKKIKTECDTANSENKKSSSEAG